MNFFVHLNIKEDIWRMFISEGFWSPLTPIVFFFSFLFFFILWKSCSSCLVYQYCSQYIILRSPAEGNSYKVKKNNRIFIFGWTFPRKQPNIAAVAICVNNVKPNIRRKSLPCPWLNHFCKNKNESILNLYSEDYSVYLYFTLYNIMFFIQCFKFFQVGRFVMYLCSHCYSWLFTCLQ